MAVKSPYHAQSLIQLHAGMPVMMERAACHTPACHFDPVIFRRLPGGGHFAFDCFIHIHFLSLPFALQQSLKGSDRLFIYRKEIGWFYSVELQKSLFLWKVHWTSYKNIPTADFWIFSPSFITKDRKNLTRGQIYFYNVKCVHTKSRAALMPPGSCKIPKS